MSTVRHGVLALARAAGAFAAARRRNAGTLQILCYHGFSLADEHLFRPKLYMRGQRFRDRMLWLKASGYRVLPLGEALRRLADGSLPRDSIAITIDDGFRGTAEVAAPILREVGFPATVYVTSYYVTHPNPVFRLAVQYMFWRTHAHSFEGFGLAPGLGARSPVRGPEGERVMFGLIEHAETQLTEAQRVDLCGELGRRLAVDYRAIVATGALSIMTPAQLAALPESGIDVELHTHRHRLPRDERAIRREIDDNRAVLEPIAGRRLTHFCYPSGVWHRSQWPALAGLGIESATTCDPGPNARGSAMLGLTRLLDADNLDLLEFEAELTGFKHGMRKLLHRSARGDAAGIGEGA